MSLQQFKLETLNDLDGGKAVKALAAHLARAAADCEDRPRDAKPRVVKLEIKLVPVCEEDSNDCDEVKATIFATSSLPPQKTKAYSLGLRRGGMLVFNADAPDNVHQQTLMDGDDGE